MPEDVRERLAVLETQYGNMTEKLSEIATDVRETRDLLQQARGARWVIAGMAGLAGTAAGWIATIIHPLGLGK